MARTSRQSRVSPTAGAARRARPGSVLVLVIVLLVLMALIGTAWITSTRSDSYAARQNTYNTQIELLVQGTRNLVNSAIVGDLFDAGQYRKVANPAALLTPPLPDFQLRLPPPFAWPATNGDPPPAERTEYEHYDSPWWDFFLASRMPGILRTVRLAADSDPAQVTLEAWPAVSAPPVSGGRFETPFAATLVGGSRTNFTFNNLPYGYYQRHVVFPDFIDVPTSTGGTRRMPALRIRDRFNPSAANREVVVLAADADGDGMADSGLWRLPVGQIEGVTYYAAVRVVDNNSAVNAAIAANPVQTAAPYAPFVAIPGNFSPVNLDLAHALPVPAEMDNFDVWRFNAQNVADLNPGSTLFDPRQDNPPTTRNDFRFISRYDALWNQLGRRLDNPGFNGLNVNPVRSYRALPIGESMALARNFVVADLTGSRSILEDYLRSALWPGNPTATGDAYGNTRVRWQRYLPNQRDVWFDDNFKLDEQSSNPVLTKRPLRWALVARNPVANLAPNQLRGLQNAPAAYQFGDYFTTQTGPKLVCVNPALANAGVLPTVNRPDVWALQPWAEAPTKISANTGSFGQLWPAFWSVMVEGRDPTPAANPTGYPFFPAGTINTPTQLFAKPAVRTTTGTDLLSVYQKQQLRAALAAVNAMDLRDADNDVTSRLVVLNDPTGAVAPVAAMVFGTERQPYITNVYARNDNSPTPYVAVEVYNPYPIPIVMRNWRFAAVNRAAPLMTMALMTTTNAWVDDPTSPIIPANGYAVFASSETPPAGMLPLTATTTPLPRNTATVPTAGSALLYVVPELAGIGANQLVETSFGNELVLLRPRRGDGFLTRSFDPFDTGNVETRDLDPSNPFDESANPLDRVPVDSYDFSTMATPAEVLLDNALTAEWRYARPTNGVPWTWVYPGVYDSTRVKPGAINQPRHLPTLFNPTPGSDPAALQLFGVPHPVVNPATYAPVPLQINSPGWASPGKWTDGTPVFFPYGGFARNGDLLQVPFIGAYRLFTFTGPSGVFVGAANQKYNMVQPFLEQNVVSIDSDRANTDLPDNEEQIGRFCPLYIPASGVDDYSPNPGLHRYAFATHLFDHLTVQSPQEDYLPDTESRLVDPTLVYPAGAGTPALPIPDRKYPSNPDPEPIANQTSGQANNGLAAYNAVGQYGREDTASVQGLINVNTAPWPVLAMVPFFPPTAYQDQNGNGLDDHNEFIAKAIVYYRDTNDGSGQPHGPFRSLAELNKVVVPGAAAPPVGPGFQNRLNTYTQDGLTAAGFDPIGQDLDDADGDLSPLGAGGDLVIGDFESRFQMLTNVSNLLTTRSDSFTVYILVQGWRNVGDPNTPPELVVQRRVAFIADRSVVTPTNPSMSITNVPTD